METKAEEVETMELMGQVAVAGAAQEHGAPVWELALDRQTQTERHLGLLDHQSVLPESHSGLPT